MGEAAPAAARATRGTGGDARDQVGRPGGSLPRSWADLEAAVQKQTGQARWGQGTRRSSAQSIGGEGVGVGVWEDVVSSRDLRKMS